MTLSPDRIIDYLRDEAGRPLKAKELARALGVGEVDYADFREQLHALETEGLLYRVQRQRYAAPEKINLVRGRLQTIRSGAGFVVPEAGDEDLFVPAEGLASAIDGDRVIARVERRRRGERPQGRVIRVIERGRETLVGVFHPARNFGFVTPEDRKVPRDVFVPPGHESSAVEGDVVVVHVTDWGDGHKGPVGEVTRVLGPLDAPGVDVLAVAYGHELPLQFPPEVEEEAARVRERGIAPAEAERRVDLRADLVMTIDPADAKDHDDALSIRARDDGRFDVAIHIADVAHYVEPGGAIDLEALRRGTSVYLVDRTIPMLPEALSTDLCSLRPDVDRLALSLRLVMDRDGKVHEERLVRSLIRCGHRLSYDAAQAILDGAADAPAALRDALRDLAALSTALRARRAARGSIDFDLPEARVVLDEEGVPVDIQRVERLQSHRIVEDFMLLANETIARRAVRADIPFLYRVHDHPAPDRVEQLRDFLARFGIRLASGAEPGPREFQRAISQAEGRPEETLVTTVMLRSMKQARYSAERIGHFGLAAGHYTHFTSPIRRYPDLVVHRLASAAFVDAAPAATDDEALEAIARTSSQRERVAVDAERDSVDLKKVEFMERHVGDEFEGTVSGVTSFGLFVLLDRYHVEGLVHVSSLEDDYYIFLEEQFALLGENTRNRFQIGGRVHVRVVRVDREQRKIDFELLREEPPAPAARRGGRAGGGGKGGAAKGGGGKGGGRGGQGGGRKTRGGRGGKRRGGGPGGGPKSGGSGRTARGRAGGRGRAFDTSAVGR